MLSPLQINRIFYHHPCVDGNMGFVIAKQYYEKLGKEVKYEPCGIGKINIDGIENECILFIDITVNKQIMVKLMEKNKILILDHHKTAMENLKDIPEANKVFDMKKSGATLAWNYFHPTEEAPLVVKYVEDRDIWTRKLKNNELFYAWFYKLPSTYEEYVKYFDNNLFSDAIGLNTNEETELVGTKAGNYRQVDEYYIKEALNYTSTPQFLEIGDKYYYVANTNSMVLKSEIGNLLFEKYKLIDFSCVTSNNMNNTHISLRSIPTAADVGEVAKVYGGGGHSEASGIKSAHLISHMGKLLDDGITYKYLEDIYIEGICVYMYSPVNKAALAKYLLQRRRVGGLQNCVDIYNKLEKELPEKTKWDSDIYKQLNKQNEIHSVQIAIVWDYNPIKDITYMIAKFDETIPKQSKDILSESYKLDFDTPFQFKGLHKTLTYNTHNYLIKDTEDK